MRMGLSRFAWKHCGGATQVVLLLLSLMILSKTLRRNEDDSSDNESIEALNEFANKIMRLAPMNLESQSRVDKAKSYRYDGMHATYLSDALVDMFSFSSKCEIDDAQNDGHFRERRVKDFTTIVLLHSSAVNLKKRRIVRETWAKPEWCRKHGVLVRFVMGVPSTAEDVSKLPAEYRRYGDILVGNFSDTSKATTLNSLLGLRWAHKFCTNAKYIVQATDDNIIRFDKLNSVLRIFRREENSESILGRLALQTFLEVKRRGNPYFFEDGFANREKYPPFCMMDAGFIMPIKLTRDFYKYAWGEVDPLPFADVFVGLAAESFHWKLKDCTLFSSKRIKEACSMSDRFTSKVPEDVSELRSFVGMIFDKYFMKDCERPDLDIIYDGKKADNTRYFHEVLQLARAPPEIVCKDSSDRDATLVVLISSKPDQGDIRDIIRKTWASHAYIADLPMSIKIIFVIGQSDPKDNILKEALYKEHSMKNHDLLEGFFVDSFKNLTLKQLFGLKWVSENCKQARYILKTDDDTFANLKNIVNLLLDKEDRGQAIKELYLGKGGSEVRDLDPKSKYHVSSEEFDGKIIPQYLVGGGFVISTDLAPLVLTEATRTPLMHSLDDAFLGILMRKMGVKQVINQGFYYSEESTDPCFLRDSKFMTSHLHGRMKEVVEIWSNFMDPAIECK